MEDGDTVELSSVTWLEGYEGFLILTECLRCMNEWSYKCVAVQITLISGIRRIDDFVTENRQSVTQLEDGDTVELSSVTWLEGYQGLLSACFAKLRRLVGRERWMIDWLYKCVAVQINLISGTRRIDNFITEQ